MCVNFSLNIPNNWSGVLRFLVCLLKEAIFQIQGKKNKTAKIILKTGFSFHSL